MIKYNLRLKSLIIFFLLFFISPLMANKNSNSDNLYIKKLKEFEKSQIEIDLIFAEYCHFHDDPICFEEIDISQQEDNDTKEITKNNEGITFYTSANVNLREKPTTNSTVLVLILKNEPIIVYEVANENSNWFLAEYDSVVGYVSADYVSKDKPSTKQITKNVINKNENKNSNENEIDWSEYIEKEIKECKEAYDPINSINLRENHNDYCSCYPEPITEVTTSEDIKYIQENDEGSDEFVEKVGEIKSNCAIKTNFYFEEDDTEEMKELTNKNIKECKSNYAKDSSLSRNEHNNFCTCYEKKWLSIVSDEDIEYHEQNNEPSDIFLEKEEELAMFCISELIK